MRSVTRREFCGRTLAAGALALGVGSACQAATNWIDRRQVGPFVCQATFPLVNYSSLLAELEPQERELRRVLAVRPCQSPIYLNMLSSERQYKRYVSQQFPEVPYRRALFVKRDGMANVFVYAHDELAVDVRHECTHALLHADLSMVPLWLDEGLAEYFEVAKPMRARNSPHLVEIQRDLRKGPIPDIGELESKERLEDLTASDYRYAWAWTHFMLHGPVAAHAELVTFLNDIRRHTAPGSLSARIARAVPGASQQLARHFRHLRPV